MFPHFLHLGLSMRSSVLIGVGDSPLLRHLKQLWRCCGEGIVCEGRQHSLQQLFFPEGELPIRTGSALTLVSSSSSAAVSDSPTGPGF